MRLLTTSILLFFTCVLSAQVDVFDLFAEVNNAPRIPSDILRITRLDYNFCLDEVPEPDTSIEVNGKLLEFCVVAKEVTEYESNLAYSETSYNAEGDFMFTSRYKYNALGFPLEWEIDFGDSAAASLMNSKKEYRYDDQNRIVSIIDRDKEVCRINYGVKEPGTIKSIWIDAGFAHMILSSTKVGDKIRYEFAIDTTVEVDDMMLGMRNKILSEPRNYIEQTSASGYNVFIGYKENQETGEFEKRWETTRRPDYKILSKKEYEADGSLKLHEEYEYTDTGQLKKTTNYILETEDVNEFDADGKLIVEHEPYHTAFHYYDNKGNRVKTALTVTEQFYR
ncbi:MAG: hypothetical protein R2792_18230 [Saprospiraceae bacterium]